MGTDEPVRIAMWSGPRNISTAMMRSWGSRRDTQVFDEPFYAHYLAKSGAPHPGAAEVIVRHPTNAKEVVKQILAPLPHGKRIHYQKHMTHHMLPSVPRDWFPSVRHAFLIRDPDEVLASLVQVLPDPGIEETGLPQEVALFEEVERVTGQRPPVVDASDVLKTTAATLTLLCNALDVPYDSAMLAWSRGRRSTDGVWAKHWYAAVEASTGFQPYQKKDPLVPQRLGGIRAECRQLYERLAKYRMRPTGD